MKPWSSYPDGFLELLVIFFFSGDHKLTLPDWIRSLMSGSKSFWPMLLFPTVSFWTFSGIATFVTRLRACCFFGWNFRWWCFHDAFSLRESTEGVKVWWWMPSLAVVVPANSFVSSASRGNLGATRKNFVRAFAFKVIPTRVDVVVRKTLLRHLWTY